MKYYEDLVPHIYIPEPAITEVNFFGKITKILISLLEDFLKKYA